MRRGRGTETDTYAGDLTIRGSRNAPLLDRIAWYGGNSGVSYDGGRDCSGWEGKQYQSQRCGTHTVGRKAPNAFGIHDMLGNCVGVGRGLERGLSGWLGNGSSGAPIRLGPGLSGRQLDQLRQELPVGGSQRGLAGPPPHLPRLPPAEDGITLGSITLLPLAARSASGRAGRSEGSGAAAPEPSGEPPARWRGESAGDHKCRKPTLLCSTSCASGALCTLCCDEGLG